MVSRAAVTKRPSRCNALFSHKPCTTPKPRDGGIFFHFAFSRSYKHSLWLRREKKEIQYLFVCRLLLVRVRTH
jgi:hypothetical protein